MSTNYKISDANISHIPEKKAIKCFLLYEKLKILDLISEKSSMKKLQKFKKKSLIHEIIMEKEIWAIVTISS